MLKIGMVMIVASICLKPQTNLMFKTGERSTK